MTRHHITLSSCELSLDYDPLREPPRPIALRNENYEDKFDFTTLFYDCFWNTRQDAVIMIGPPPFNLRQDLEIQITAYPSGTRCERRSIGSVSLTRVVVKVPTGTTAIIIKAGRTDFYVVPQPNLSTLFRERRVVMAISKDNETEWIRDWITFYRKKHDCSGILIYDNQSKLYSTTELYDRLAPSNAELLTVIVPWNFRYGVDDYRTSISYLMADGLYCQKGMLEHARFRFLENAKSVLNVDIDELVLAERDASVFSIAEKSETGLISIKGKWVENFASLASGGPPRHKFFVHLEQSDNCGCEPKWAVVPQRVPYEAQWFVHFIYGMSASEPEEAVELRHFKAINTNWNLDRSRSESLRTASPPPDPEKLCLDPILQAAFLDVFGDEDMASPTPESVPRFWGAYRLRLRGSRYAAAKNWSEAIDAVQAASELMPEHPGFQLYLSQLYNRMGDPVAANKHRTQADALREKDPWYHFQKGRWLQDEGDFEAARQCYERTLTIAPSFALAYSKLAELERFIGRPAKVLPLMTAYVQHCPKDPLGHFLLAREFDRRKRRCDALHFCEAAISLNSSEPHFLGFRARLLRLLNRISEAEQVLRKAIAIDTFSVRMTAFESGWSKPGDQMQFERYLRVPYDLFAELAELMVKKGDLTSAEAAARNSLVHASTTPRNYGLLFEILNLQGKKDEAEEVLARGIIIARREEARPISGAGPVTRHHSNRASRADQLAQLLRLADQRDEAIAVLKSGLSAAPDSALLRQRLAELLAEAGDVKRAVEILRIGIARKPEETSLHEKLSLILADRDLDGVVEAARTASAIEPDNPVLGKRLAKLLMEAGQDEEAERVLLALLELEPEDGELQFRLSKVLQRRQRLDAAIGAAQRAIELQPQKPNHRDHLAALLLQQGQTKQAEAILRQALQDRVENGAVHYRLSRVLWKQGRRKEALAAASAAVQLEPEKTFLRRHWAALLTEAGQTHEAERVLVGKVNHASSI